MKNKRILIGVTGGVAIYKVLSLISKLKKNNYEVRIIMTESATKMINPILFETMGRCKVHTDLFVRDEDSIVHIDISKDCDLFLVAPATANIIAKTANGIADDLLSTTLLASSSKIAFAPAMNTRMLNNPMTQENIKKLKDLGYYFIESNPGFLACNEIGDGRMAEADELFDNIERIIEKKDLINKNIIVTGGPTITEIDSVRYIINKSSGKMGYEIAKAARNRGANVKLVLGKTNLKALNHADTVNVNTNEEMLNEIEKSYKDADALIMAAAPMDFIYKDKSNEKIKKEKENEILDIKLEEILKHFGDKKGEKILIGFAAESDNNKILDYAKEKLEVKNLDFIVANNIKQENAGFDVDTNIATIISKNGEIESLPLMTKEKLANKILDKLV